MIVPNLKFSSRWFSPIIAAQPQRGHGWSWVFDPLSVCSTVSHGALRRVFNEILSTDRISVEIFSLCRFLDISIDFSRNFCRRIGFLSRFPAVQRIQFHRWLQTAIHFLLKTASFKIFKWQSTSRPRWSWLNGILRFEFNSQLVEECG